MGFGSIIGSVLGGGNPIAGSLIGGVADSLISGGAAKKASSAQLAGADASLKLQADMYNQSREDLAPYRKTGQLANDRLAYLLGLTPQYDRNQIATELGFGGGSSSSFSSGGYNPSAPPVMIQSVNGDQITLTDGRVVSRAEFDQRLRAPDVAPHIPAGFQPAAGVDVSRLYQGTGGGMTAGDNAAIDREIAARKGELYKPYGAGTKDVRVTAVNGDGSYKLSDGRTVTAGEFLARLAAPDVKPNVDQKFRPKVGSDVSRLFGVEKIQQDPTNVSSSEGYGSLAKRFGLEDYVQDPGYQFRLSEGNKAINAAQAARGGFYSGAALKEANKYNSNMASQEYGAAYDRFNNDQNNLYNRLAGVANTGMGATNSGVNQNYATNAGNIYQDIGNVKAASGIAQSNIWSQGIGNGLANLFGGGQSSYQQLPWTTAGNVNPRGGFY